MKKLTYIEVFATPQFHIDQARTHLQSTNGKQGARYAGLVGLALKHLEEVGTKLPSAYEVDIVNEAIANLRQMNSCANAKQRNALRAKVAGNLQHIALRLPPAFNHVTDDTNGTITEWWYQREEE